MSNISIESFANPQLSWEAMNDPVMGGRSHSDVSIKNDLGFFDGEVVDVPFLHAPGFITMRGNGGSLPDVSTCDSLQLRLRASEPYSGYRISFGNRHVPGNRFARGYKADFDAPVGPKMGTVVIPFHDFTVRWDDATGDPVVTCQENEAFCPDKETLQDMKTISFWGEGVAGKVHLEIESIEGVGCSPQHAILPSPQQAILRTAIASKDGGSESSFALPLIFLAALAALFVLARSRSRRFYKVVRNSSRVPDADVL